MLCVGLAWNLISKTINSLPQKVGGRKQEMLEGEGGGETHTQRQMGISEE